METKDIPLEKVESSQISAIGHDAATNTLRIQFAAKVGLGSVYDYANFTEEQFAEFKAAESVGSWFGKHIKPATEAHPFTKISGPQKLKLFQIGDDIYAAYTAEQAARLWLEDTSEVSETDDVRELTDEDLDAEFDEADENEQPTGKKTTHRRYLNETTEPGWFAGRA